MLIVKLNAGVVSLEQLCASASHTREDEKLDREVVVVDVTTMTKIADCTLKRNKASH